MRTFRLWDCIRADVYVGIDQKKENLIFFEWNINFTQENIFFLIADDSKELSVINMFVFLKEYFQTGPEDNQCNKIEEIINFHVSKYRQLDHTDRSLIL